MSSRRSYRRVSVKEISLESLRNVVERKACGGVTVGMDIAKAEIVVVVRFDDGSYELPWSVKNPSEVGLLVERLCQLKEICGGLVVALESTGTYGDAVRFAMTEAFLEVHRISGKAVSDYKEIFDGVPSQHDGKDAAMIAELAAFGKGKPWPYEQQSEIDAQIAHQLARLDAHRTQANQWLGRIEGILARHWPELTEQLKLGSATLRKICQTYGSPAALVADPDAAKQLRSWGRGQLKLPKIQQIVASAKQTSGLPMNASQLAWLAEVATAATSALTEVSAAEKQLQQLAMQHEAIAPYVKKIGAVTLCAIFATVGDPRKYGSSGAFLKALGLNLKELSSGKRNGELAITKRGPSLARKLLYYWALRAVQDPALKDWYRRFTRVGNSKAQKTSDYRKMKGLVAMMRKLCKSLWYVYRHDQPFEYAKVFPGKPLDKPRQRTHRRPRVTA